MGVLLDGVVRPFSCSCCAVRFRALLERGDGLSGEAGEMAEAKVMGVKCRLDRT